MTTDKTSILVLDDDQIVLDSLTEFLRVEGYDVTPCQALADALARLENRQFQVAITDVRLPEGSGFDLLERVRALNLSTAIIMLTGYGTIGDAVRAIKMGAFDYVTKPIADGDIQLAIERALQQRELIEENRRLREQLNMTFHFENLVCRDPKMKRALDMIKVVAGTDATVLITGESGTGKTLAARAIHANSQRAGKPFVEVSCGTLPDTLLESELFGHVKGAFSGAIATKTGKFQAAHEGTIFLDEISIASPSLQMKLLRVLEDFKFEPVGSNDTREVNVRLVLATNQELSELVTQGVFREDLFYRINVMNIELPPLRERPQDVAPLAQHFVQKYSHEALHPVVGIADDTMRLLSSYEWPGNVRELENVLQRAVVLCRTSYILPEDLPSRFTQGPEPVLPEGKILPLKEAMRRWERHLLLESLRAHGGNRKETARILGINRTTLYNKMRDYGISDV